MGAFATHEEAEACAADKQKLHDHKYAGELADRFFITPPKGQGEMYEVKRPGK
ncbi:hypothetical protein [Vitreimonas flagellata]|uniref:hypothetical protein n=1 Tax=Vitreimonas flagellata TaxID=2560861 RepID=UPI0014310F53|nr:hypothetical protein [Vitreimonas flagellata]